MNRRKSIKTGAFASLALTLGISTSHAASGMLGKMGPDEWKKANADAGASVKALSAGSDALSKDDADLLKEIAAGGMMQLKLSEVAASKGSSEDVKMIAAAEVEEQTIVGAKVKEIAKAGGVSLSDDPDEDTRKAEEKLKSMKESQVLKDLAKTTLPIIKIHLQVSHMENAG